MAGTNYKINPVKATCIKYTGRENAIQGLNDTCFGICAAFSGTYDTFAMDPKCTQSCTDFIEQRKRDIFGVGSCDHQVPYRPVAWEQIPRYVPKLLKNKGMRVEEARKVCKRLCSKQVPFLATECQETCDLDANAVEEYEIPPPPQPVQVVRDNKIEEEKTKHPIIFWTILAIIIIILAIVTYKMMA
jgi:hypothetical protein